MAKSRDPYVYVGTSVLINRENIRDAAELAEFERLMTAQRLSEGLPEITLTPEGYGALHRHLFQDVYEWAGRTRTVDIAKSNSMFCLAAYVDPELGKRLAAIRAEHGLRGLDATLFAARAAEHCSELNAIHPFREGNGRSLRAFLVVLGRQAGHEVKIQHIDADHWNQASRDSFRNGDVTLMRQVIDSVMVAA